MALEAPSLVLGLPLPPQTWSPQIDTTIPVALQASFFAQWVTSYFTHGDLSKRNPDTLAYILPATHRVPTIFNISPEEQIEIINEAPNTAVDTPFMIGCISQNNTSFVRACFDEGLRKGLLTRLEVWSICGDQTASFAIPAFWQIQDEDKKRGGGLVKTLMIAGVNHFVSGCVQRDGVMIHYEDYRCNGTTPRNQWTRISRRWPSSGFNSRLASQTVYVYPVSSMDCCIFCHPRPFAKVPCRSVFR